MDEATENQERLAQQLLALKTNIKKDSPSRKTLEYLNKKSGKTQELWSEFKDAHIGIKEYYGDSHKSHPYFAGNYYSQTEKVYKEIIAMLRVQPFIEGSEAAEPVNTFRKQNVSDQHKISQNTTTAGGSNDTVIQKDVSGHLTSSQKPTPFESESFTMENTNPDPVFFVQAEKEQRLEAFIRGINNTLNLPCSKSLLELKSKTLQEYWSSYVDTHYKIMASDSTSTYRDDYVRRDAFQQLEDATQVTLAKILDHLDNCGSAQPQHIKLPPIDIPKFYGEYNKWSPFHDLFKKLIHESRTLNSIQKMNYLKTYICGSAAKLISHLQVSSENYQAAWDIVNARYNNKRLLVSTQINILLAQPNLSVESIAGLKNLHDTTSECLHAIQNLEIDTTTWSPILVHILTQKLDKESHRFFELSLTNPKEVPTTECFLSFLETRFQSLEAVDNGKSVSKQYKNSENTTSYYKSQNVKTFVTTTKATCKLCKKEHSIANCPDFQRMDLNNRRHTIRRLNFCIRCLGSHDLLDCRFAVKCNECNGGHHTLMHLPPPSAPTKRIQQVAANKPVDHKPSCSHTTYEVHSNVAENVKNQNIILGTAMIKIITTDGKEEEVRLLVDPGSQATFITERCVKRLKLPKLQTNIKIIGMGATDAGTATGLVHLNIRSRFPSNFNLEVKALVFKTLTKEQPERFFNVSKWNHLKNLVWADSNFSKPGPIDIVLGADYYGNIILNGIVKGNKNEPIAQYTEFGWVIMGQTGDTTNSVCSMTTLVDIENGLKSFWELEELPERRKLSKEDLECEEHYNSTHRREENGTYTVKIPYKANIEDKPLGNSKNRALARFLQVERKLARSPSLKIEYMDFMDGYLNLDHMKLADPVTDNRMTYYMPHHAVFKESSSTTKTRVVFDASAKSNSGLSLNEIMMTGPTLQQDLYSILLRWRKHRFAYTADIEKMFRQIKIDEQDQDVQRILWRTAPSEPIKEYKLNTVTYGTASATYLAVKTLRQLAIDDEKLYPIASKIALNDFYVDDLMSGSNSLEDAIEAQAQLRKLLKGGGFNLRKWTSNNQELLQQIPQASREFKEVEIKFDDTIKALGILWNPLPDMFHFNVNFQQTQEKQTKRKVLSDASKLFDPLGWLAPTIILAKIFLQELWLSGLDWDQELPEHLSERWKRYRNNLKALEEIKIERWISHQNQENSVEFHAFCDASEAAYGAVIYTRITDISGNVTVTLLTGKAKVAPIKTKLSIPRLELCGAVLASRLIKITTDAMAIRNYKIFAWTDSTIVLAWLRGPPNKWTTFVGNRVSEVHEVTNPSQWQHVNTEDNPADCVSRGIDPDKLKTHNIWWNGPKWLQKSSEHWPNTSFKDTKLEEKNVVSVNISSIKSSTVLIELFEKFSSLSKIKNILTYCQRFISNSKITKSERQYGLPTVIEQQKTFELIVRMTQLDEFGKEYTTNGESKVFSKSGKLSQLNPYFDKNGIIRLGGRAQEAAISTNSASPIILPSNNSLTKLLIREAHIKTCHGGTQLTLAYLRQNFWILNARNTVRNLNKKCTICFRYNAKCREQLMGILPAPRVKPSQPFTHTGIDYAGPIQVRVSKGRGNKSYKGYICIFVCLATKAIHIEVVSDLTTTAFLAAFKRFTSRRGLCTNLYSDNGTNFVGANTTLKKELEAAVKKTQGEAAEFLLQNAIQWKFIPPSSPHFGGLWEAGVKSTKYHLKRIIGETTLTFEELATVLSQIEACLNSRPLCPMTSDPTDLAVLTPGHFLIGRQLLAVPEECLLNEKIGSLQRWKLVQKMAQDFWKIWSTEYLARLQQRPKWLSQQICIKTGDLVLIKDDQNPPSRWSLGRVKETHPGKDGLVRVATLKTKNNDNLKRPIAKICLLPISDNEPSDIDQHLSNQKDDAIICNISTKKTSVTNPRRQLSMLQLMSLVLLLILSVSGQSKDEPIKNNILPSYAEEPSFESLSWKVVVYYNMADYYQELSNHRKQYDELKNSCEQLDGFAGLVRNACDAIVEEFGNSLNQIIRADEVLKRTNQDTNMDERYALLLDKKVESFKISKANTNNVVILEAAHIINESHVSDAINAEEINVQKIFSSNSRHLDANNARSKFLAMAKQYVLRAHKFKAIQQLLLDTIMDVQRGNNSKIPEIKELVKVVQKFTPIGYTVPFQDTIKEVVTRVTNNNIIFCLNITMVESEKKMSADDIHLYTVSYSTAAVLFGVIGYLIWDRKRIVRTPASLPRSRFILEESPV